MRIWIYLKRCISSIKSFLISSFANLLDTATQITVFIAIIVWLDIVNNETRKNFEISQNLDIKNKEFFFAFETMAENFNFYTKIQSLAIFFIILQIYRFLYFSPQMAKLLDVLDNAKMDIIFFVMMFSIVLLAFALLGFFTFGTEVKEFENFNISLLTCLIMIIGITDLENLLNVDPQMGSLFYFAFMVNKSFGFLIKFILKIVMNLILLKMFIAILDGHYNDYKNIYQDSRQVIE